MVSCGINNTVTMLINLSNHPFDRWGEDQKAAAAVFGECRDIPFPPIPADFDAARVAELAEKYAAGIMDLDGDITVHIMGEQTFCFALISRLLKKGIPCIASCTERDVTTLPDGSKQVRFHFSRFRPYSSL